MAKSYVICTIGHSNRTIDEFLHLLEIFDVKLLVDIRHYPGSRHCPQFGKARLRTSLLKKKIDYIHLEILGGRRRVDKNSELNAGWRSPQFRGYADYMQTKDFRAGLKELMSLARKNNVAIMCSEAVPWRCHRSMVGDALLIHNFLVLDIMAETVIRPHELTSFAEVHGTKITYPLMTK